MNRNLEAFKVDVEGDAIVVAPQGDSHGFRYDALHYEYNQIHKALLAPDIRHLVVDLISVEFLGSLMLGVIIKLSKRVKDRGGKVVLCNASDQMKSILDMQNLTSVWPLFPARSDALRALVG
jgi:anti-anti-sigma factor